MKYILYIFISFLFLTTSNAQAQIQPIPEKEQQKIIQDLIQHVFDDIWSDMDSLAISKYHTEDFILLEHGEIWTNETIKSYIKKSISSGNKTERINFIELIRTRQAGNKIWAAYNNDAKFFEGADQTGSSHWLESVVAIKTDEGWKLEMMHSTWSPR